MANRKQDTTKTPDPTTPEQQQQTPPPAVPPPEPIAPPVTPPVTPPPVAPPAPVPTVRKPAVAAVDYVVLSCIGCNSNDTVRIDVDVKKPFHKRLCRSCGKEFKEPGGR